MKLLINLTLLTLLIPPLFGQQDETKEQHSLDLYSSLIIDNIYNFDGGIQPGGTILGLFDFSIEYSPSNEGIFSNTSFYGHLLKTGGKGASENFIGDAQIASNIEGRASRFVYELYVIQQIRDFLLSLGLHDLNTEFMVSNYAGDFINSSFGIFPTVSLNVPVSIFPVTSIGGIVTYNKKHYDVAFGFYNLNHEYIEEEEFNIKNHLYNKGYLSVLEIRYRLSSEKGLNGEYKIGGFYKDCHHLEDALEHNDCSTEKNYGVYFIADQVLWSSSRNLKIGMFSQLGIVPKKTNYVPDYYGLGISLMTTSKKYAPDFIGLAIGSVGLNSFNDAHEVIGNSRETTIELSIKKELFDRISLQPDIQYIINPFGIHPNAFAGILRLQIELNN